MPTIEEVQTSTFQLQSQAGGLDEDPFSHDTVPTTRLERTDGGQRAWTILIAGVIFEALFWGVYSLLPSLVHNSANI